MTVNGDMLKENIIFSGMTPKEIDQSLKELFAAERSFKKVKIQYAFLVL